jgi:hypothetical protein
VEFQLDPHVTEWEFCSLSHSSPDSLYEKFVTLVTELNEENTDIETVQNKLSIGSIISCTHLQVLLERPHQGGIWAEHTARIKIINSYKTLVEKPERKRPLGRQVLGNIKADINSSVV